MEKSLFLDAKPNPDWPGVNDVEPSDVHEHLHKLTLIDVRRPEEWVGELSHIKVARHIVLDTLESHLNEIPKGAPLVFICRSGQRSAKAVQIAQGAGLSPCFNMRGGMMAWNSLGYEVEDLG